MAIIFPWSRQKSGIGATLSDKTHTNHQTWNVTVKKFALCDLRKSRAWVVFGLFLLFSQWLCENVMGLTTTTTRPYTYSSLSLQLNITATGWHEFLIVVFGVRKSSVFFVFLLPGHLECKSKHQWKKRSGRKSRLDRRKKNPNHSIYLNRFSPLLQACLRTEEDLEELLAAVVKVARCFGIGITKHVLMSSSNECTFHKGEPNGSWLIAELCKARKVSREFFAGSVEYAYLTLTYEWRTMDERETRGTNFTRPQE